MAILILSVSFFLQACKKNDLPYEPEMTVVNKEVKNKIITWLTAKMLVSPNPTKSKTIESLIKHLDFSRGTIEPYKAGDRFVIVPIREGLNLNSPQKPLSNYLVAVMDNNGVVKKANIIQYLPKDGQPAVIPSNTIFKIFTYQDIACNGQFAVLNIAGQFLYKLAFDEGKLRAISEFGKGALPASGRTAECINWFLVTTYYYSDGTTEQTREFLFQTCTSETGTGPNCPPDYLCYSGDGGGVAPPINIDYEYEVVKASDYEWTVQNIPEDFGGGLLLQSHHLVAKFNNRNTAKNRFVGGNGANILIALSNWGQNGNVAYSNTSAPVTINTNTQATLGSSGSLRFSNNITYDYSGSKTISLSDCNWY